MKNLIFILLALLVFLVPGTKAQSGAGIEDKSTNSLIFIAVVTPSNTDSIKLAGKWPRALYVGVSGDVTITTLSGTNVTIDSLAAGVWHPIMYKKVRSTGTTATNILTGR